MLKKFREVYDVNIILTFVIIVIVIAILFKTTFYINKINKNESISDLNIVTVELANTTKNVLNREIEQLDVMARVIGNNEIIDSKATRDFLESYVGEGIMGEYYILLPNNDVLCYDGIKGQNKISYEEIANKGKHISSVTQDIFDESKRTVYFYVPIENNGSVNGMLCGSLDLDKLSKELYLNEYNGKMKFSIIESSTGEIVIDTNAGKVGNIADFSATEVEKGYDYNKFQQDIKNKENGDIVFKGILYNNDLVCSYHPTDFNDWMVLINISEKNLFVNVCKVNKIFMLTGLIISIILIFYFVYIYSKNKREKAENMIEYGRVHFMYNVEKLLFDAHIDNDNYVRALEYIAESLLADKAFFVYRDENNEMRGFQWNSHLLSIFVDYIKKNRYKKFEKYFNKANGGIIINNIEDIRRLDSNLYDDFIYMDISNMMISPINNVNSNEIVGFIAVCNMSKKWDNTLLLDSAALSFTMAYNNMKTHTIIEKVATVDKLTGLLNRNCFIDNMESYKKLWV